MSGNAGRRADAPTIPPDIVFRLLQAVEKPRVIAGAVRGGSALGLGWSWRVLVPSSPASPPDRICVVSTDSWPSHSAMTERSTPAWSRSIAAVCLKRCTVTRLCLKDGHVRAAVCRCLFSSTGRRES